MLVQQAVADQGSLDGAEQYPRGLEIIRPEAEIDDLAHRSIAHQIVGDLHGDFHRRLGGALIARGFDLVLLLRFWFAGSGSADEIGAVAGGAADATDLLRGLDVAERPLR